MGDNKQSVITFKVDAALAEIIRMQPNRSDFIRKAILNSIENSCPLCQGTGIITPQQKIHWQSFMENHNIEKCNDCNAVHIVCKK